MILYPGFHGGIRLCERENFIIFFFPRVPSWCCGVYIGVWTQFLDRCASDQKKESYNATHRTANIWYFIGLTLIWKENELSHLLQCIHFLIFCRRQLRQLQFFSDQSRNNVAPSVCRPDDDNDVCVHYYTGAISGYFCFYNDIMMPCFNGMASCGVTTMLSKCSSLSPKLLTLNEFLSLQSLSRFVSYFCH